MTRKDTILIAVIINAGLLAVLFATAIIYDTDKDDIQPEGSSVLADATDAFSVNTPIVTSTVAQTVDEVDNALTYYSHPSHVAAAMEQQPENFMISQAPVNASSVFEDEYVPLANSPSTSQITKDDYVEVTVKKGDSLDKIARANGTTVSAIKTANNLPNEKLSIGQVLRVPLKKDKQTKATPKIAETKETASNDAVYYTLKSGDNPWKIAKQFNVSTEDIVRLNNLDESKARNLKAGDRIRVK